MVANDAAVVARQAWCWWLLAFTFFGSDARWLVVFGKLQARWKEASMVAVLWCCTGSRAWFVFINVEKMMEDDGSGRCER